MASLKTYSQRNSTTIPHYWTKIRAGCRMCFVLKYLKVAVLYIYIQVVFLMATDGMATSSEYPLDFVLCRDTFPGSSVLLFRFDH